MQSACATVRFVASIQIRNVPPKLHRELKRKAEKQGVSLQEYLLGELEQIAEQPTLQEWIARVRGRELVALSETGAETVRAVRAERERELDRR